MEKGRFGIFGGQYVPETLMNEIHDLTEAYERYKEDSEFQRNWKRYLIPMQADRQVYTMPNG